MELLPHQLQPMLLDFEQEGLITRTFRRLDPERQLAVVAAILDESVESGPSDINIKQVAARANVAVGSLYTYFGDRQGLLQFAVRLCARTVGEEMASYEQILAAMPLSDGLRAMVTGGIEWSNQQAKLTQFLARAAYHGESDLTDQLVRPVARSMRRMAHGMLKGGMGRGQVRTDIDLEATSRVIHLLLSTLADSQLLPYLDAYYQVTDEHMRFDRVLDACVALITRGLQASKTSSRRKPSPKPRVRKAKQRE